MREKTKKIEVPAEAKVYEFGPAVEVCRNCQGTGQIDGYIKMHDLCDVCNGTGRILKKKTVVIDVKPYKQES